MLRFEPDQVTEALTLFRDAHDKVRKLAIEAEGRLQMRPMARDDVSTEVAEEITRKGIEGETSALAAIRGYRDQLKAIVDQLEATARQYGIADERSGDQFREGRRA
ncbi:PE domain-containing protein [Longimycelium tulufanense]|uniref:PE domain-containing protein n=1 Tax=Longimycelium tulufanense TaxID=907463 RepID=UPI001663AC40|nr:PE domain-containing protein [Longimycelium tulufanense]